MRVRQPAELLCIAKAKFYLKPGSVEVQDFLTRECGVSREEQIAYVVLPIDLISAKRFPILGWLDEVVSLSVAYNKVQHHITQEMERKVDEILDKWFPEYTKYEIIE